MSGKVINTTQLCSWLLSLFPAGGALFLRCMEGVSPYPSCGGGWESLRLGLQQGSDVWAGSGRQFRNLTANQCHSLKSACSRLMVKLSAFHLWTELCFALTFTPYLNIFSSSSSLSFLCLLGSEQNTNPGTLCLFQFSRHFSPICSF